MTHARATALLLAVLGGCSSASGEGDESEQTSASSSSDTGESSSSWSPDSGEQSSETGPPPTLDETLAALLAAQEIPVAPLAPLPAQDPALVALGEALFFDPILSGPKDTACASCHHPEWASGDGLSLTLGTGASGVGPARAEGEHPPFVPRHAMALFNLGDPSVTRLFWDARVELDEAGVLQTPLGEQLPADIAAELDGVLAAQALFPVLDRLEMRGEPGSQTVLDEPNELAALPDDDPAAIWAAIMDRLQAIPGYVELFAAAYPDQDLATLDFAHAANAIAAYEREAFALPSAPWDAYLDGQLDALSDAAKLGAILFYGAAACANCHSGPLLSDHQIHATGVPQLGPGKPGSAPYDHGRELVSGDAEQRFGFRTPPLRNVAETAPYMHDGALVTLQQVLVHYADPTTIIDKLDRDLLLPELAATVHDDPAHVAELVGSLSPLLADDPAFVGLSNIREFLESLSDPAIAELPGLRPETVPSGLPPA